MALRKRSSWQVFRSVVFALIVRELRTRFGKWRLGYVWAILEPLLSITVLVLVVTFLRGRSPWFGIPVPVFVAVGFMLFFFFRILSVAAVNAITANSALFGYRQVKPFDTLVARMILETIIFLGSALAIMFIGHWFFGLDVIPYDPIRAMAVVVLMVIVGFGLGLLFSVLGALNPEAAKLVPLMNRPLLFLSCVMYPLAAVPEHLRPFILWNPLVHAIEQFRLAMFPFYPADGTSLFFLFQWAIVSMALGTLVYMAKRHKLVAT